MTASRAGRPASVPAAALPAAEKNEHVRMHAVSQCRRAGRSGPGVCRAVCSRAALPARAVTAATGMAKRQARSGGTRTGAGRRRQRSCQHCGITDAPAGAGTGRTRWRAGSKRAGGGSPAVCTGCDLDTAGDVGLPRKPQVTSRYLGPTRADPSDPCGQPQSASPPRRTGGAENRAGQKTGRSHATEPGRLSGLGKPPEPRRTRRQEWILPDGTGI